MAKSRKSVRHGNKASRSASIIGDARSIAVVSGKGGSGKTMVVTAMAQGIALAGKQVVIIDADMGTGGLSYYLGFSAFDSIREGFSEFVLQSDKRSSDPVFTFPRMEIVADRPYFKNIALMAVGEQRLAEETPEKSLLEAIPRLLRTLGTGVDFVIFDCRGGIDRESLMVCNFVSNIVLIVETDAAAIRASQHLVNVLTKHGNSRKISGFILNKVMDDPSSLAKAGESFFSARFLGAIPFDIEATRDFIKGQIPSAMSLFCRHVYPPLSKLFPQVGSWPHTPTLENREFANVSLKDPELNVGAAFIFLVILALMALNGVALFSTMIHMNESQFMLLFLGFSLAVVLSFSDGFKKFTGRLIRSMSQFLQRRAVKLRLK